MTELRVLMVCLGNICRSPTAAVVLRHQAQSLAPSPLLTVDGAGTADYHIGEPPDRRSIEHALRRGYDLRGERARQVGRDDFFRFDLILSADRSNLAVLQRMAPANSQSRVALLLDFAPDQPVREVPDPYYGGPEDFERVIDLCELAAAGVLAHATRT